MKGSITRFIAKRAAQGRTSGILRRGPIYQRLPRGRFPTRTPPHPRRPASGNERRGPGMKRRGPSSRPEYLDEG